MVDNRRRAVATSLARSCGRVSRLWGQKGLGTMFRALRRLPVIGRVHDAVELSDGGWFETEVFEPCWGPVVFGGRPYERELSAVLRRFAHLRPAFIDGGANYGYWSVVASALHYDGILAIEAHPKTFVFLARNAELNGEAFRCEQRALTDTSGMELLISVEHDVNAHVTIGGRGTPVRSCTVGELVAKHELTNPRVVLKLDVEGQEKAALVGAANLRSTRDHAIIFEDWPETNFDVVQQLLDENYTLFYVDQLARCTVIHSTDGAAKARAADRLKSDHGTNFVATRRGALEDVLSRWVDSPPQSAARRGD